MDKISKALNVISKTENPIIKTDMVGVLRRHIKQLESQTMTPEKAREVLGETNFTKKRYLQWPISGCTPEELRAIACLMEGR